MKKLIRSLFSGKIQVIVATLIAVLTMGFSDLAICQESTAVITAEKIGRWFISAPVRETAPKAEVDAAALKAVSVCPGGLVLCAGVASGDKETSPKNTEYASNRLVQCLAAVSRAKGTPVAEKFLATGTGDVPGRGIRMSCASSGAVASSPAVSSPGQDGRDGHDGKDGKDATAQAFKKVFRPGFRTGLGFATMPGIQGRQLWGTFDLGVVILLKPTEKFGFEGGVAYGDLFRGESGNWLHTLTFTGGIVLGPWSWFGLYGGYRFTTGMTPDSSRAWLQENLGEFRLDFWLHDLVQLSPFVIAGQAIHDGQKSRIENRADGSRWRVTDVLQFRGWMVGGGLYLTVYIW